MHVFGTRYLETRVKRKSRFIPEEKTTSLNSNVCQVQASRCWWFGGNRELYTPLFPIICNSSSCVPAVFLPTHLSPD